MTIKIKKAGTYYVVEFGKGSVVAKTKKEATQDANAFRQLKKMAKKK